MSLYHVLTTADSTRGTHQLQKLNYHLCSQSAASDSDKNVQTYLKSKKLYTHPIRTKLGTPCTLTARISNLKVMQQYRVHRLAVYFSSGFAKESYKQPIYDVAVQDTTPPTPIKHIQSKDLLYTPFRYNLPEFVSPKYFFFHAFLAVLGPWSTFVFCSTSQHLWWTHRL